LLVNISLKERLVYLSGLTLAVKFPPSKPISIRLAVLSATLQMLELEFVHKTLEQPGRLLRIVKYMELTVLLPGYSFYINLQFGPE
jgi:hypothetical protein